MAKAKQAVKYAYWKRGDKKPTKRPKGCEVADANGHWSESTWHPSEWEYSPRRWPKVKVKAKAKPAPTKWTMWYPGRKKPKRTPDDCQWKSSDGRWFTEYHDPKDWKTWTRRWPNREPDFVYWNPGDPLPAHCPKQCTVQSAIGWWWSEYSDPVMWNSSSRRWPKSSKVKAVRPAPVKVKEVGPNYKKLLEAMLRGTKVSRAGLLTLGCEYFVGITKSEEEALVKIKKGMK